MPEEPDERFSEQPEVVDALGMALAQIALNMASLDTSDGKAVTRECLEQTLKSIDAFIRERGMTERDRLCLQKLFEDAEGEIESDCAPCTHSASGRRRRHPCGYGVR